ncbi:MAG: thioredoxin family protein [Muribaculaceae bacterium]|nr:thioredoxin family protein [Muribaculaceae bacterium]
MRKLFLAGMFLIGLFTDFVAISAICLSAFSAAGENTRVYDHPDYALRMMWELTPTRVERTPDATSISFHCTYPPGWQIKVDSTVCIVEPRTGTKYAPVATEVLTLNEGFTIPESGEVDFSVIFPVIPDTINEVDYLDGSWKIYGLRLDGSKAVKLSDVDLDEWEREHRKSYPGMPDKFFSPGEAVISGVIRGYDPRAGFDNISVYHSSCVTGEQRPYLAHVAPDGSFRVTIPMEGPGYVSPANFLRQWQWYYAEPGRTLEIAFDWEDLLKSMYRKGIYRDYSNPPARFGGDVGDINVRLSAAPAHESAPVQEWASELTPSEVAVKLAEIYRNDSAAVESYIDSNGIDDHTARILRHNARGNYLFELCDYLLYRDNMRYNNPGAPSLAQPLTKDFFNAMKEPLEENDEWFLGSRWMAALPNRIAFQCLDNRELGYKSVSRYEYYDLGFDFLRSKGAELTPDEDAYENYIRSRIGSYDYVTDEGWNEIVHKYNSVLNSIASRYGLQDDLNRHMEDFSATMTDSLNFDATAENMRRWATMIKDYYGTDTMPLLIQASLSSMICRSNLIDKSSYTYDRIKDILDEVKSTGVISDPDIFAIIEDYFAEYYRLQGSPLPDDERGRVVRDIITPYSGKLVLLDFWATWCGPCRHNIESSAEERSRLRENPDFKMIFITSDEDSPLSTYEKYVAENLEGEVSLRLPLSDYNKLRDLFGISSIPRCVLIGRDGNVITQDFPHNHHSPLTDTLKFYGLRE